MNSKLKEHLRNRDIAPILAQSTENDDEMALKMMCIIDHALLKRGFYSQIIAEPKLIHQLLGFKSFSSFNYWKYIKPLKFPDDYVLECWNCKLVGPYYLILSHMATTHNTHVGSKTCLYCKNVDTKAHIEDSTLQRCYHEYLTKNAIDNTTYPEFIVKFYDMLQELAKILRVLHTRTEVYTANGRKRKQNWFNIDEEGDIDESVIVFENNTKTIVDAKKLDMLFRKVIEAFYGGEQGREFLKNLNVTPQRKCQSNANGRGLEKKIKPNDNKQSPSSTSMTGGASLQTSTPTSSKDSTLTETNDEETDFMNSIMTFLSNLDEKDKKRAKLEIQVVALNYSTKAIEKKDSDQ